MILLLRVNPRGQIRRWPKLLQLAERNKDILQLDIKDILPGGDVEKERLRPASNRASTIRKLILERLGPSSRLSRSWLEVLRDFVYSSNKSGPRCPVQWKGGHPHPDRLSSEHYQTHFPWHEAFNKPERTTSGESWEGSVASSPIKQSETRGKSA